MNPKAYDYKWYGARGINVCERWREYANFYADMGPRPPGFTIERVDNSKGYGPDNCVWAPWHGQAKNSRQARFISLEEETLCVGDMAALTGIKAGKIYYRAWDHKISHQDSLAHYVTQKMLEAIGA